MSSQFRSQVLDALANSLGLPHSAYESAAERYRDLGEWLNDGSKAKSARHDPFVHPQGSFRLGTATKPWGREGYDLDLACTLRQGIDQNSWSQEQLKRLVGDDLERYRRERGIHDELEEKHRCWRLNYRDRLSFHIDAVPGIPQRDATRRNLRESMVMAGAAEDLAETVSALAVAITDDRHPCYQERTPDWLVSNPEGYARWFEARMRQAEQFLEARLLLEKVASVEDLPTYRWKTPLQRCVQMLKRHRDVMFERASDRKPISIIITTLAARAYAGEADLATALDNILDKMSELVSRSHPTIPNPVNPQEDFADRWGTEDGRKLRLEQAFWQWLEQARTDFQLLLGSRDPDFVSRQALQKFGARLEDEALSRMMPGPRDVTSPRHHRIADPPKPWRR